MCKYSHEFNCKRREIVSSRANTVSPIIIKQRGGIMLPSGTVTDNGRNVIAAFNLPGFNRYHQRIANWIDIGLSSPFC